VKRDARPSAEFAADVAKNTPNTTQLMASTDTASMNMGTRAREIGHVEEEVISAAPANPLWKRGSHRRRRDSPPGETRARALAAHGSTRRFPRDLPASRNPRSRFQRPFRSGGRDRGRIAVADAR